MQAAKIIMLICGATGIFKGLSEQSAYLYFLGCAFIAISTMIEDKKEGDKDK